MGFPHIKFGICQICGDRGNDYPNPGAGNAPARDLIGNGVVLEYYDELLLCNVCIATRKADEKSLLDAEKHAEEDQFRAKAGFRNSIQ